MAEDGEVKLKRRSGFELRFGLPTPQNSPNTSAGDMEWSPLNSPNKNPNNTQYNHQHNNSQSSPSSPNSPTKLQNDELQQVHEMQERFRIIARCENALLSGEEFIVPKSEETEKIEKRRSVIDETVLESRFRGQEMYREPQTIHECFSLVLFALSRLVLLSARSRWAYAMAAVVVACVIYRLF